MGYFTDPYDTLDLGRSIGRSSGGSPSYQLLPPSAITNLGSGHRPADRPYNKGQALHPRLTVQAMQTLQFTPSRARRRDQETQTSVTPWHGFMDLRRSNQRSRALGDPPFSRVSRTLFLASNLVSEEPGPPPPILQGVPKRKASHNLTSP